MRAVGTFLAVVIAATSVQAQPAPNVDQAKTLYDAAQAAMTDARYADAIRDYGAAYELTKDPVLLFKLGTAHQKAGSCELALGFYRRYLKEGRPDEPFVNLTKDRIVACGGDPAVDTAPEPAPPPPPPPTPPPVATKPVQPPPPPAKPAPMLGRHRAAWLLVGGSIAFVTIGSVLAYSSNAAERDLEDLYVGLGGSPPVFDARTRERYEDVVAEGQRYETLSWISFGIAGGLAIGAAVRFLTASETVIAPTVNARGAGISAVRAF